MKDINYENYFWQNELVRLRSIEERDWEVHHYNRFDTQGRRLVNLEVELPPTRAEADEFVEKFINFKPGTGRLMFTIENHDGENVGALNLNAINEKNGTFSIGMMIDRDHRGKGYGTAAMEILLGYAFYERRLNKYYGHVIEGNIGSIAMLKKLGCVQEGVRRQMIYTDGKYHDEILFGLTKDDFMERERKKAY